MRESVMPNAVTHPSAQELNAFGQGKLSDAAATTIARHLETCLDCQEAVANLPPDAFVAKVKAAKASSSSLPPGQAPVLPTRQPSVPGTPAVDAPGVPAAVPPELANHAKYCIERELGRGGMGVVYQA